MSTPPATLLDALNSADMLEIDELHAWQFDLEPQLLQQHQSGAAGNGEAPLLRIECMDGRNLRKWTFSLSQVLAATHEAARDSWLISGNDAQHRITCFAAFSGDNQDEPDEDEQPE